MAETLDRRRQDVELAELRTWARGHDDLCQTREDNALDHRKQLVGRIKRIEGVLMAQFGTVILGVGAVLWAVLKLYFKLP